METQRGGRSGGKLQTLHIRNRGKFPDASFTVMAGLVPAIHAVVRQKLHLVVRFRCDGLQIMGVFLRPFGNVLRMEARSRVDGRDKPGHDVPILGICPVTGVSH